MVKRRRSWLRRYFTSGGRIAANEFAGMIRPFYVATSLPEGE